MRQLIVLAIVVGGMCGPAAADYINLPIKYSQTPWASNRTDWFSDCMQ